MEQPGTANRKFKKCFMVIRKQKYLKIVSIYLSGKNRSVFIFPHSAIIFPVFN